MSGHSKWSKIKHQKAVTDVKKGRVFSQLGRQITISVKEGGSGDPADNPRLRLALEKAREANMPKDNVKRAIDRGLGASSSGSALSEITIEGYAPGGVAIMAAAITDNQNRTKSEIRQIFDRHGGSLGEPGSVAYIFASGRPSYMITLPPEAKTRVIRMIELLDDHEDVESVRHNANLA